MIFSFQNCGEVQFSAPQMAPVNDAGTPTPLPPCDSGMTRVNGVCQPLTSLFRECMSFEELGAQVEIPSLAATGRCYYKKLLSGLPLAASGTRGETWAEDVIARRHGAADARPDVPGGTHPFVLGDAATALTLLGNRNLSLTSSSVGSVNEIENYKLKIDNFILVELQIPSATKSLARGTADSEPSGGKILLNGAGVNDFISYAPGGTANVDVVSLGEVPVGELRLRVRMLDCGGSAQATDMYLVIH
jgi:hypothetical protein